MCNQFDNAIRILEKLSEKEKLELVRIIKSSYLKKNYEVLEEEELDFINVILSHQ